MDTEFVTSTVGGLTPDSRSAYDPCLPIGELRFEPGKIYGPFFRVDREDWTPFLKPTDKNWAGLAEPHTKEAAINRYSPHCSNPMTHVHQFFVKILDDTHNAIGFVGKVKDGTGFQIGFNHIAVKYIFDHQKKELPE